MTSRRLRYLLAVCAGLAGVGQLVAVLSLRPGVARLALATASEFLVLVGLVGFLAALYVDSMNKNREAALSPRADGRSLPDQDA